MKLKIILIINVFIIAVGVFSGCQSESELNFQRYYTAGQLLYQSHCQNCHGEKGEGLGALIPPLNDSLYLKNNLHHLPCIIRNGQQGNITINDKPYSQQMPPHNDLSPIEIAQVITYINNSFNNQLGLTDVQQVNVDLQKCN